MNPVLIAGGLLGFLSVAIGAGVDHILRADQEAESLRQVMTALRYHQIGALIVAGIGLALTRPVGDETGRRLNLAAWLFVGGTILFSFSIYLANGLGLPALTYATPVGGITLMLAWLALVRAGWHGT